MFNAIRLGRSPPPSVLTTPLPPQLRRRSSPELRSRQVIGLATAPADQSSDNMDDSKNTVKKTGLDIFSAFYIYPWELHGFEGKILTDFLIWRV